MVNGQSQTAAMPKMTVNNFTFPGQIEDGETGTFYSYFRNYQAGTGRYLQSDPIGLAGACIGMGMLGGSPIRKIDSVGLECQVSIGLGGFGGIDFGGFNALKGDGPIGGFGFGSFGIVVASGLAIGIQGTIGGGRGYGAFLGGGIQGGLL